MATTIRIKPDAASVTFRTPGFSPPTTRRKSSSQFRRPRTVSLSRRLRSASDLEQKGVINGRQKGVVQGLVLDGDSEVLLALDAYDEGKEEELLQLLDSGVLNRSPSVDLLEQLDLDPLNIGVPPFQNFVEEGGSFDLTMKHVIVEEGDEDDDLAFVNGMSLADLLDSNPPSRRPSVALATRSLPQEGGAFDHAGLDTLESLPATPNFLAPEAFEDFFEIEHPELLGSDERIRRRSLSRSSMDFGRLPARLKVEEEPQKSAVSTKLRLPTRKPCGSETAVSSKRKSARERRSQGENSTPANQKSGEPKSPLVQTDSEERETSSAPSDPLKGKKIVRMFSTPVRKPEKGEPKKVVKTSGSNQKVKPAFIMANINGKTQFLRALKAPPPGAKVVNLSEISTLAAPKSSARRPGSAKKLDSRSSSGSPCKKTSGGYSPEARKKRIDKFQGKTKRRTGAKGGKRDLRTNQVIFLRKHDEDRLHKAAASRDNAEAPRPESDSA